MAVVKTAVRFPETTLLLTVGLLVGVQYAYSNFGAGVEFFPNVEPDYGLLYVHARGNLSLAEMDAATSMAEDRILGWPGVKSVYTRAGKSRGGGGGAAASRRGRRRRHPVRVHRLARAQAGA